MRKGDSFSRQSLIETNDLLGSVIPGLSLDSFENVKVFIETTRKTIIDSDQLSRNIKLLFLSIKNLERFLPLYQSNHARDLIHSFFLHICTSPGTGVCYQDHGFYPPLKKNLKIYNKILHGLLEKLSFRDPLQRELMFSVLKACPELMKSYVFLRKTHR